MSSKKDLNLNLKNNLKNKGNVSSIVGKKENFLLHEICEFHFMELLCKFQQSEIYSEESAIDINFLHGTSNIHWGMFHSVKRLANTTTD